MGMTDQNSNLENLGQQNHSGTQQGVFDFENVVRCEWAGGGSLSCSWSRMDTNFGCSISFGQCKYKFSIRKWHVTMFMRVLWIHPLMCYKSKNVNNCHVKKTKEPSVC